MGDKIKSLALWLIVAIILISVFNTIPPKQSLSSDKQISYNQTEFLQQVQTGKVDSIIVPVQPYQIISGTLQDGKAFTVTISPQDTELLANLTKAGVNIKIGPMPVQQFLLQTFLNWFPMLLLIGVWVFFMLRFRKTGKNFFDKDNKTNQDGSGF